MSKDSWPTPQDYNEAIQSPRACFTDPDLMYGQVMTNSIGLPRSMTGAFASVYKIVNGDKSWAVRCFLTNRLDQRERYKHISNFVLFDDLDCTIDFYYLDEGIKIKGNWYPCLKMPWVEGETIDQYIVRQYKTPGALKQLLTDFHDMVDQLENAGIGHGDLQHGNIIVTSEGLRLVDYDALYVPALAGRKSLELGHPNYQHPDRNEHHYDQDVDNFSCWLIHASILAIAIDPLLFERHGGGDECLLFRRHDLASPEKSRLFDELKNHTSEHLREAAILLERMLWAQPLTVPILDCPAEQLDILPRVRGQHPMPEEQTAPDKEVANNLSTTPLPPRNRFDFIDDDALIVQNRAKQIQTTTRQRLSKLGNSNKKMVDNLYLWLSPHFWTKTQMQQALSQFDIGNYDDALNIYLTVYRTINQKFTLPEELFWCLMGLGYCSGLTDKTSMAGNYFLLATKNTESTSEKLRAGLCLAVTRYESKEFDGAYKALSEHLKEDEIVDAVKLEMKNVFVMRSSTYHLLRSSVERLLNAGDRQRATKLVLAAQLLLNELVKTRSIDAKDKEIIQSMTSQAQRLWQQGFHLFAHKTFKGVAELCLDARQIDLAWDALLLSLARCACCPDLAESSNLRSFTIRTLASTMKSSSPKDLARFSKAIDSNNQFVGADNLRDTLFELVGDCLTNGLEEQSVRLMIIANRFASKQKILLTSSTVNLLKRFPDKYVWPILSEGFLEHDEEIGQLVDLLGKNSDIRILAKIGIELASEQKSVTLSAFFMHLSFYCQSTVVDAVSRLIVQDCAGKEEGKTMSRSLTESCKFFLSELEGLTTHRTPSKKDSTEGQRLLNAVFSLRSILEQIDPACDLDWIADTLVLPQYSSIVSNWMLSLANNLGRKRLTEFLQMLINRCGVNTVGEFIVGLTMSNQTNDLETIISAICAWGVSKEELSSMLRPAIDHCLSRLENKLKELLEHKVELKYSSLIDEMHLFQSLYQLIGIAKESQLNFNCDAQIARIYCNENMPALSMIARHHDIGKQTLGGIAIDMAIHKPDDLVKLVLKLVDKQNKQSLYDICQTLLLSSMVPPVVSLCERLQEHDPHFFSAMCHLTLRTLNDETITELSDKLISQKRPDLNAVLIRELKSIDRPALLIKLICRTPNSNFKVDIKVAKTDFSDLSYTSSVAHMAALSGDANLAKFLDDLDDNNVQRDERIVICSWAAVKCRETLKELKERISSKGETGNVSDVIEIGVLNMSALERLFLLCETSSGDNEALAIMHDPENRAFFIAWVQEQGRNNDIDKLAFFYMRAARQNEISALTAIVLELAQLNKLRLLISLARQICSAGYGSSMAKVLNSVAEAGLTEAFGAISLELVTSTADRGILMQLLTDICDSDPALIRVLLRQIAFYRGAETLTWLSKQHLRDKSDQSEIVNKELKSIGFSQLVKEILPA